MIGGKQAAGRAISCRGNAGCAGAHMYYTSWDKHDARPSHRAQTTLNRGACCSKKGAGEASCKSGWKLGGLDVAQARRSAVHPAPTLISPSTSSSSFTSGRASPACVDKGPEMLRSGGALACCKPPEGGVSGGHCQQNQRRAPVQFPSR